MIRRRPCALLVALAVMLGTGAPAPASERAIVLQSTTSTDNSGLFEHILPLFTAKTGIEVRVVAVGTGQALENARRGDGDAVLVHSPADEIRFYEEGWGILYCRVMYNDFVIVGPRADPADIRGLRDAVAALRRIARARAPFVSRGDRSGTHRRELALWREAGLDPAGTRAPWYLESGAGMGATLNIAAGRGAYTLTDRGTWLSFGNRADLEVLVEGDPRLFNPYGVMVVNPERHPHVRFAEAKAFRDWLVSPEGQRAIASFRLRGERLFHPAARCGDPREIATSPPSP